MKKSNGMATAGLVLGIIAMPFNFIPFFGWVSWVLTPLAIIFSCVGMSRSSENGGKGKAVAGLVLGILGVVSYWVSWLIIGAAVAAS
tara:strand:- start:9986 stop:10246 length:261 start_codon:yes stop_codon:yes gene_type:complete